MIRTELIEDRSWTNADLKSGINHFLKDHPDVKLIDIKYQMAMAPDGRGVNYSKSALIVYETESPDGSIEKCSFCDGYGPIMSTNDATLEFDGNQLLVLSMGKNAQKYDGTEAV
ncbi:sporulation protein Cse60 [Secundilactobacillus similis]|uniref:Uncharacterized protein n=1 Tax=Secundilactobacillus similis DSM 23365 = JCM 2765 TaxID=1423804 RepID=A0A0R2EW60_9LACO|nr:sporulation protein Cse60 [Secundilactobacillus similis]KRN20639.1 hypothetical protein FD14_GL001426 [Secundilactobacillus similis DSM 23365 = JCM 2765]